MMECLNCIYSNDCGTTIPYGAPCYSQAKELESAITDEVKNNYGEITPRGKNIIKKIAEDIVFGELILVDDEIEKNADKLKIYGNSYDVCSGNFMFDEFAEKIVIAQKKCLHMLQG